METGQLKGIIEAALLAYGQPLGIEQLREIFDEFERPDATAVRKALLALADDCEGRPMELVEVASGWRLQVRSQFSTRLSKLWQERPTRYSRALLETLALIAYRQPITRGEIEDVRGVTVNPNIVRTLTERGWIRVVGHREVPGHPELLEPEARPGLDVVRFSSRHVNADLAGRRLLGRCDGSHDPVRVEVRKIMGHLTSSRKRHRRRIRPRPR